MSNIQVHPIKAFNDNYIWCLSHNQSCVVVDPGDAAPVLKYCEEQGFTLTDILITHHHWDHTNGIADLLAAFGDLPVYGPYNPGIVSLTHHLREGDGIRLNSLGLDLSVLEVPGHTLDHIAYLTQLGIFCGDTLFSGGCGRLFEGTAEQMHLSLNKLAALPPETSVYCTHEYTLANLNFALAVEPHNSDLVEYNEWAKQQISLGQPTLPSYIGREKAVNPFLRAQEEEIKNNVEKHLGTPLGDQVSVFAALRGWKDNF